MKLSIKNIDILFPKFALLLYAISPITESKDWIFYTVTISAIILFIIAFASLLLKSRKNSRNFLNYIQESVQDNSFDLIIAICGLTVSYSMDLTERVYFWLLILAVTVVGFIFPLNLNKKQKKH